MQAEEASDQVILATEHMDYLNLTALEQQLQSKQDALQGKLIALQELQASLLHPNELKLHFTADFHTSQLLYMVPSCVWLLAPRHSFCCLCM